MRLCRGFGKKSFSENLMHGIQRYGFDQVNLALKLWVSFGAIAMHVCLCFVQISALYKTQKVSIIAIMRGFGRLWLNINAWNPKVQCGFDQINLVLKPWASFGAIAMHVCYVLCKSQLCIKLIKFRELRLCEMLWEQFFRKNQNFHKLKHGIKRYSADLI